MLCLHRRYNIIFIDVHYDSNRILFISGNKLKSLNGFDSRYIFVGYKSSSKATTNINHHNQAS